MFGADFLGKLSLGKAFLFSGLDEGADKRELRLKSVILGFYLRIFENLFFVSIEVKMGGHIAYMLYQLGFSVKGSLAGESPRGVVKNRTVQVTT